MMTFVPEGLPTCHKCNREAPEGAVYCPFCGRPLNPKRNKHKRGNGQGTAVQRGKTWTARVVVAYKLSNDDPPHKQPVYRTKGGFKTKREALDYCVTLKAQDFKPKGPAPQLIAYWQIYENGELESLSKSKQTAYKGAWRKLKAIHYRPVDQLTVAELRETVNAVASTYYTVRDCKSVLTNLFKLAGADGWCSKDIPSYIVMPKLEEKQRTAFTVEEQTALWKLYESGDLRAAIPLLMICTGIMPGEAQNLRVEHIDLASRKITGVGVKTKVRKATPVYIPHDLLPVMEDLISNAQSSGYIFVRNEDKWYTDYYSALAAAKCRRLEPYCCRHTTATRLAITENIAPQTIQRMMRWSTTKMLDRYAHPDDADVFQAANTFTRSEKPKGNPDGEPPADEPQTLLPTMLPT